MSHALAKGDLIQKGDLTFSQTTNFRPFQTEAFADDNSKLDENDRKVLERVENTEGKGEIVSSFPTVFSEDLYLRHIKTRACLGKG